MTEPILQSLSVTLLDAHSDFDQNQTIRLMGSPHGVSLFAEGYGDHCTAEGHGSPVSIELYEGELRLLVWADINTEEPTNIISLGAAKENRRRSRTDHDDPFHIALFDATGRGTQQEVIAEPIVGKRLTD